MALRLVPDFKEFLRLLNAHRVEYLVIGGYAVSLHGYPRATDDLDIWVGASQANAPKIVRALKEFGFATPGLKAKLFTRRDRIVRMGVEPMEIELFTSIPGVAFNKYYARRVIRKSGDVEIPLISLDDLKINKKASGRFKDLSDLENLP